MADNTLARKRSGQAPGRDARSLELYSAELDWYVTQRDAACGVRSSLGGQIAALERGGAAGTPNSDPYTDGQVGMGPVRVRAFTLDRRIGPRWGRLSHAHRGVLVCYYLGRAQGSEDVQERARTVARVTHGYDSARKFPIGVEGLFAPFAAIVMVIDAERASKLGAHSHGRKPSGDVQRAVAKLTSQAERVVRAAHRAYYEIARIEADGPDVVPTWSEQWDEMRLRRERFADGAFADNLPEADVPRRGQDGVWR